jgi:hypothetical protein
MLFVYTVICFYPRVLDGCLSGPETGVSVAKKLMRVARRVVCSQLDFEYAYLRRPSEVDS